MIFSSDFKTEVFFHNSDKRGDNFPDYRVQFKNHIDCAYNLLVQNCPMAPPGFKVNKI